MKKVIILLFITPLFTSCSSQKNPLNKAKEVQNATAQTRPGTVPSKVGSWMMTAIVNGVPWKATSLMPPEIGSRIVGYYNNEYIGLPYNKQDMKTGKKIALGPDEAADISFTGIELATTKNGEMEITKSDEKWVEGKFYFSCSINGTTTVLKVTDGFFRISLTSTR
jgi:hypothetical protein